MEMKLVVVPMSDGGRANGFAESHKTYGSFASLGDPDGNGCWFLQKGGDAPSGGLTTRS